MASSNTNKIRRTLMVVIALGLCLATPLIAFPLQQSQQAKSKSGQPPQNLSDVSKLEVGKPIEREIKGGESHTYEIALEAGQYLNVVADQQGVDVAVTVIGPDGKQIFEFNSESRKQGQETVTVVADVSGSYRLNIRPVDKKAAAGRYGIQVSHLRAATEEDFKLQEARKLYNESIRLFRNDQYDEALSRGERALAIRERVLGPDHPEVARSLHVLGSTYGNNGDFVKAEFLYQRALAINEKALGPDHPEVARSLDFLGMNYTDRGEYAKAEPLLQRALTIREKALGPDHVTVAYVLNNLGNLYKDKGEYAKAELLYQRALAIYEKVLGPDHATVGDLLNSLAIVYKLKRDYDKAEPLLKRALAILEETLGPDHPDLADEINNLANLYDEKGDYAKAELLHQRALAIREKALGPDHPEVANSLGNLANLYNDTGDYVKAEPLYHRALAIKEKALGPDHPDLADSLNNLAELYRNRGDYAKAAPLHQRALAIKEKALGPDHPNVAESLVNLASLYRDKGDYANALEYLSRAVKVSEHNIALNVAYGSERQKLLYLGALSEQTNNIISMHVQFVPGGVAARNLAVTIVLQRKGRALDAMADSIAGLRRRADIQDRELIDQLTDARSRLSKVVLGGPGKSKPAEYRAEIKRLEEEIDELEANISRRSAEFRVQSQPVTLEAIQAAMPNNAALVEFTVYTPLNLKAAKRDERYGRPRYIAYVLRHQGEPTWVELGEAKPIDEAINSLRGVLRRDEDKPLSNIDRDVKPLARKVDELVMRPVRRLIGKTHRVFISPDGMLNLIPFGALVEEKGQYLVKYYHFTYLTSGRDLLRLKERLPSKQGMMIIANPDYGPMSNGDASRSVKGGAVKTVDKMQTPAASDPFTSDKAIDLSQVEFSPLAGTEQEARALKAMMPEATTMMREQATKAVIKQADAPSILHVATHGFFLEALVSGASDSGGVSSHLNTSAMPVENPLLRSGLAMAGANLHKSDDNGILTALEVSGLNLWGTKLVVLSACETGLGEVKTGNGIFGLRRALVLAGSESQILSLWKVDDEATRDLMIDYYTHLKASEGRSEALHQVQLKMLANPRYQHPYFWASFIESGEWANLDGKR